MSLPIEIIVHILSFQKQSIVYRSGKLMNCIASDDSRYAMLDSFRWKVHINNIRILHFNKFQYHVSLFPYIHFEEILWDDTYFNWLSKELIPNIVYYEVEFNYESIVHYLQ